MKKEKDLLGLQGLALLVLFTLSTLQVCVAKSCKDYEILQLYRSIPEYRIDSNYESKPNHLD